VKSRILFLIPTRTTLKFILRFHYTSVFLYTPEIPPPATKNQGESHNNIKQKKKTKKKKKEIFPPKNTQGNEVNTVW